MNQRSQLTAIRQHLSINRLLLDAIALGVGQVTTEVCKYLLEDILLFARVDDLILLLICDQGPLRLLYLSLQLTELLVHPSRAADRIVLLSEVGVEVSVGDSGSHLRG